ncbi:M16 family metallopeptidase [Fibrobacter sp.]|uniref:M16 family metallopeptidase n=1 Tax=Fibrobacter sp. TaxID=35828 RepID=UPI00388EA757
MKNFHKSDYRKTVLPNGVVVLTDYMPHAFSASVGVWLPRGSRHEKKGEFGLSHFYEHLVFKGSENRSALEIAHSIEDRGGNLEAYTTRQETGFYANVVAEDVPLAIDVISDMLMNPRFEKSEMEKERKVIIEEIHSYDDIPEELAGDVFNAAHFAGCGIAHPITGKVRDVKALTNEQMWEYERQVLEDFPIYVCAAGKVNHEELVDLCVKKFARKKSGAEAPFDAYKSRGGVKIVEKQDISQSNLFWGTSFGFETLEENVRYALSLFNVAIGAGMASRLFQKIREENGLAYSVYSTADVYCNCVDWGVSLATEPRQLKKALSLAIEETHKFLQEGFAKDELERTKTNVVGGLRLGADSPEKRVMRLVEQTLHLGKFYPMENTIREISKVRADDVVETVRRVFDRKNFTIAVVQPDGVKKTDLGKLPIF